MKPSYTDQNLAARVYEILSENPKLSRDKLAERLGLKSNGVIRRLHESFRAGHPLPSPQATGAADPSDPGESREFNEHSAVISTRRANVRTLDELIAYMQVDLTVWEVERHVINKWEVGGKPGGNNSLKPNTDSGFAVEPLYQVKAWLRRIKPTIREASLERLLLRIEKQAPKRQPLKSPRRSRRRYLLEISLYDAHFGLLAWGKETGDSYDLKIAESRYQAAVDDLLLKTQGCAPELITLPIGNDFFHINNPEGLTPHGHNVLDVDGRMGKVLEAGELAVIRAVEACARVARVNVLWIPGNHDPDTSFYVCRVLKAYFRHQTHVTVDTGPAPRKYCHYGMNLIGYTHGNEERHADLPTIMAGENRTNWSTTKFCEWHVGHYHKQKETRYSAGDTFGGVIVRVLPSLAGTDAWHFKKGYVNGRRIAEANLFDYELGPVATYHSRDLRGT